MLLVVCTQLSFATFLVYLLHLSITCELCSINGCVFSAVVSGIIRSIQRVQKVISVGCDWQISIQFVCFCFQGPLVVVIIMINTIVSWVYEFQSSRVTERHSKALKLKNVSCIPFVLTLTAQRFSSLNVFFFILYFLLQFFSACTRTRCPFGAKCVLQEDGSESCQCPLSCPLSYVPVCGNNKKTYVNRCALNLDTCLTNGSVTLAHEGKCCKKTEASAVF